MNSAPDWYDCWVPLFNDPFGYCEANAGVASVAITSADKTNFFFREVIDESPFSSRPWPLPNLFFASHNLGLGHGISRYLDRYQMLNGKFVAWPPSIFCVAKSTLRNPFCISRLNAAPAIAAMRIVPVRNHGNAIYLQNQRSWSCENCIAAIYDSAPDEPRELSGEGDAERQKRTRRIAGAFAVAIMVRQS